MRILGVGLGGEFWQVLSVGFGENVNLCGLSLLVSKKDFGENFYPKSTLPTNLLRALHIAL